MNALKENQNNSTTSKSSPKDITENQGYTFHVEHNNQNIKHINSNQFLKYNMKKFKAFTIVGIEFLFAPSQEQAKKMFKQINPFTPLVDLIEVEINY